MCFTCCFVWLVEDLKGNIGGWSRVCEYEMYLASLVQLFSWLLWRHRPRRGVLCVLRSGSVSESVPQLLGYVRHCVLHSFVLSSFGLIQYFRWYLFLALFFKYVIYLYVLLSSTSRLHTSSVQCKLKQICSSNYMLIFGHERTVLILI